LGSSACIDSPERATAHMTTSNNVVHSFCIKLCAILSVSCVVQGEVGRQLSHPEIGGYAPTSYVHSESRIDLDQKEFEEHLASNNMAAAKAIYSLGGNAGGVASIAIPALANGASYDAVVKQGSFASGRIKVKVMATKMALQVTYDDGTCKDGGSATKEISKCFRVGDGAITIGSVNVGEPTSVSNTYLTLQGFSIAGQHEMGAWRWQEFFSVYRAYYNEGDYANARVMAALDKTGICKNCDDIARNEIAKKTSAYMSVWMYVIAKMDEGIINCRHGCLGCTLKTDLSGATLLDTSKHAWDLAVAYYGGSLEGADGKSSGKLLYELAQKRCVNFGTCTAPNKGAAVNKADIEQFSLGQFKILAGNCVEAMATKSRIVELMSVPLVQGALHYAYKVAKIAGQDGSKQKAGGAAFSAAILPRIARCNASSAKIIKDNMNIDSSAYMSAGYVKVKEAFEATYKCLGITCEDVGGLVQGDGYYASAGPCITATSGSLTATSDSDGLGTAAIVIIIVIAVLFLIMAAVALICYRRAGKYQDLAMDMEKTLTMERTLSQVARDEAPAQSAIGKLEPPTADVQV